MFPGKRTRWLACLAALLLVVPGCTDVPEGIEPVRGFELERYLGTWYEIARLDHSFERGLSHVTAEYSLLTGGGVRVVNSGYSDREGARERAEGRAYFVGPPDLGHLKVSFFGPFYGSYVIFELDLDAYQYAFVTGYDRSYLWLLARTPTVSEALRARFLARAEALGFATTELIFVDQDGR